MQNIKPYLKNILLQAPIKNNLFRRNLLKEYLQVVVLDFIYSHPKYSQLVFYGGSCLAQCYGLPRLSEDLDFVDVKKNINLADLTCDLEKYFQETDLTPIITIQKFRIYLKFPLLKELELAGAGESDLLFLKIEVFKQFSAKGGSASGGDFCKKYKTEIIPLFKQNRSILIKSFDLPTLMATKIRAILHRKWEKIDKTGKTVVSVKGRDYFDLMWYLEKNIKPNLNCIENVKDLEELRVKMLVQIENLDTRSVQLDLNAFIEDDIFVKNLSANIKDILRRGVNNMG